MVTIGTKACILLENSLQRQVPGLARPSDEPTNRDATDFLLQRLVRDDDHCNLLSSSMFVYWKRY
jgi:hypothetical protein